MVNKIALDLICTVSKIVYVQIKIICIKYIYTNQIKHKCNLRARENSHNGKYCTCKIVLSATAFHLKNQGHDHFSGIFEPEKFQFYNLFLNFKNASFKFF